jgi:putative hydrolase
MRPEEFRKCLEKPYLFHLHTRYTDGKLDVAEYFEFARKHGVSTIFFTEHVRKELKYSFPDFVAEIRTLQEQFPGIAGYIGAEAKVLPGGDLDIDRDTFEQLDVLCFACHGFPDDIELYFSSFQTLFSDERWKSKTRIFVHPGRYLKKRDWMTEENKRRLHDLLEFAMEHGVLIEENKREHLPPTIEEIPRENRVVGYDIHHQEGLSRWLLGENGG